MHYSLWYNAPTMLSARYRPATSWVHYTTSCNAQSSAPEDGQNNCPKHVELTGIINKPLSLHLLWKVTGQEHINLEIRKRKFRWIGHTLRKDDGEIPKAALLWSPQGNRKSGRPRNSWRRSVIKETGRSWNELRFLAADRQKWKGLIDNLCS